MNTLMRHDIRLRMEIERTRVGRTLIEQRLLTLELRQPPMPVSPQRFWSHQTWLRLIDMAFALIQGLFGMLRLCHHAEQSF